MEGNCGRPFKVNETIASFWVSRVPDIAMVGVVNDRETKRIAARVSGRPFLFETIFGGRRMRSLSIATLLSVVASAAAPTPHAASPRAAPVVTAKSTRAFAECFARTQDRLSAPWWFVPKANGGTFSNLGAPAVTKPYFLAVTDRGERREISLRDAAPNGAQAQGVSQ